MKKLVCLILALSLLAACGGSKEKEEPKLLQAEVLNGPLYNHPDIMGYIIFIKATGEYGTVPAKKLKMVLKNGDIINVRQDPPDSGQYAYVDSGSKVIPK